MLIRKNVPRLAALAITAIWLPGCFSMIVPARIYNLNTGQVITAELDQSTAGHGEIRASTFGGEMFAGEYVLTGFAYNHRRPVPLSFGISPDATVPPEELDQDRAKIWAERYGFGSGADARPAGTGTMVGNRGTVIEIVLYSYSDQPDVYADGIGHDNSGNWYRVHVGEVSFSY